jgi:DNA anti-recombination protein RmuC
VGGSTYTTPFVIAKDPRSTATRADLVAQYRFVNRVRDRLTETHVLAGRVRTALERVSRDSSAATRDTIARLTTLEQTLIQPRAHATQDLSNYPTRLDSKLGMLGTFAARADARPTKQAQTLLAGFEAQLAALRKQVNALAQAAATPSSIVP